MSRRPRPARRLTVRLGLFAVLFQAILFGWHHHDLSFAGQLPTAVVENPAGSPQAADDEDGCEICQVLHHLTAATVDVATAPPPPAVTVVRIKGNVALVACAPALAFRARAPPLA